jgi:Flp pilus assembly protein CpaB
MLRRSPRALILWMGATALAVTTGAVVAGELATLHRRANTFGPELRAVVATHELALGSTITPRDVATRRIHASQLPDGVLTDDTLALGRVVRVPVVRDAYISARNLTGSRRTGLDGIIPNGSRAMRVLVEDGLRPAPGSAVDVYATIDTDTLGAGRGGSEPAMVVAAGVLVLATDDTGGAGTVSRSLGVTLLVSEDQAADLAFASARGTLVLALVPPEDARAPSGLTRR